MLDIGGRESGPLRQAGGGDGAKDLGVTAEQQTASFLAIRDHGRGAGRQLQLGHGVIGKQQPDDVDALRRDPHAGSADRETGRAADRRQFLEPRPPGRYVWLGDRYQTEQRVVNLLGVARVRPRLGRHTGDRLRIELAELTRVFGQSPSEHDRARPALFDRRVVEIGVGTAAHDLVRHRRRLGGIARMHRDLAGLDALEHALEARDVHRLFEAIGERLPHECVVGNLQRAGDVLLAPDLLGKDRGHEVIGPASAGDTAGTSCRRACAARRARASRSSASAWGTAARTAPPA